MLYDASLLKLKRFAGADDQRNRLLARMAAYTLQLGLAGKNKKPDSVEQNPDNPREWQAVWAMNKFNVDNNLSSLFNRLRFVMETQDNGRYGYIGIGLDRNSQADYDNIILIYNPTDKELKQYGGSYRSFCENNAAQFANRLNNSLVHEFTHAIDAMRLNDPTYMDTVSYDSSKFNENVDEYSKYMNNPIESNAVIQAAIEKIDYKLHNDSTMQKPQSAHDMAQIVMAEVRRGRGNAELTSETWQRFMKRITQYWYDFQAYQNQQKASEEQSLNKRVV